MRIKPFLVLLLISSLFILSCSKNKHEKFGKDLASAFKSKKYVDFDTVAYYQVFKQEMVKLKPKLHDPKWINKIYDADEKGLTLMGLFLVNGQLDTLSQYLLNAEFHGLDPNYFHAQEIVALLDQIKQTQFKKVEESYPLLAQLELLSADGLINYANILKYGAVNPKTIFSTYYVSIKRPAIIDAQRTLEQLNLVKFLSDLQPVNGFYQRLMNLLINDKANETSKLSADDREKIYLSLERLRWPVQEYKGKYLLVNIPEYSLRLINDNTSIFQMKVCVGEVGHETPILSGTVDRMQVNPVWNIPESIANNEILDRLRSDVSYLEGNNMVAYKGGALVDPESVDWNSAQAGEYSFKQNPGADNSLGQIKFIFKNPFAIYLHDTPAQAMFQQSMRAVSHGCIRVQEPMKLASFLVESESETNKIIKETEAASAGGVAESRWVKVKNPVPVFISYYTAWTDDAGNLISSKDVYGYDKMLIAKFRGYMATL
jgi:hypothetical protein